MIEIITEIYDILNTITNKKFWKKLYYTSKL